MEVRVECYAGRKTDERPIRFARGERDYFIEEILDQWYGPHSAYFRVRADDGTVYVLRHDASTNVWMLEGGRPK